MSERFKRLALIVGFFLAVLCIALALYVVFFRTRASEPSLTPPPSTEEPQTTSEGLPTSGSASRTPVTAPTEPERLPEASPIANGGITQTDTVTTGRVTAPTLTASGTAAYYDRGDGRFYRIDEKGNPIRLSDATFPQASSVVWNQKGSSAVIEFPDGSNVVYDFDLQKQTTLPAHWEDFSFSPTTNEIVAKSIGTDPSNRAIVITTPDGKQTRAVAELGNNADRVTLDWSPNNSVIGFSDTAPSLSGFGRKMILPIGKNHENFPGIVVEGLGFTSQWSPQGNTLLYSAAGESDDYRPSLWVVSGDSNTIGQQRKKIGLATWADKCTFADNSTIYCAVPNQLNANVGLQRSLANSVPDSIYRINLDTGTSTRVAVPETPQSIDHLIVSPDGRQLFFTDQASGVLQKIQLN